MTDLNADLRSSDPLPAEFFVWLQAGFAKALPLALGKITDGRIPLSAEQLQAVRAELVVLAADATLDMMREDIEAAYTRWAAERLQ